jgi:enamine deaminase RidA (YjgF/YER057c/UK114 family)
MRMTGFVNATPEFGDHPAVIDGASDLMVALLGDSGRHTRTTVGVGSLPFGFAVEIDAIFALA